MDTLKKAALFLRLSNMLDFWGLVAIIAKFALYLGVLGASGVIFCALIFSIEKWKPLAFGFLTIGFFAAIFAFLLKAVALTGDHTGMTDPEMLSLLWETQSGSVLLMQLVGLSTLLLGLVLGTPGKFFAAAGGGVAIYAFVTTGHIADQDDWFVTAVLFLHLLVAALWIGILTPLQRLSSQEHSLDAAAKLGERFGALATIAVPVLIIAGVLMTWQLIGSFDAIIATSYGLALFAKIAVVAVLLSLAAANKMRFVPAMLSGDFTAGLRLSRSIQLEWIAVLLILLVTAILTSALTLPM